MQFNIFGVINCNFGNNYSYSNLNPPLLFEKKKKTDLIFICVYEISFSLKYTIYITLSRASALEDNVSPSIFPISFSNIYSGLAIKTNPSAYKSYNQTLTNSHD